MPTKTHDDLEFQKWKAAQRAVTSDDAEFAKWKAGKSSPDFSDVSSGTSSGKKKGSIFQQAAEGASFGFGDEVAGAISAVTGGTYKAGKRDYEERRKNYASDNPGKSIAAEIAGSLAPIAVSAPLSMARAGVPVTRRLLAAAAEGGVAGGIYGAGKGEGIQGKMSGAAGGAMLGATTGAALVPVAATVRAAGRVVAPAFKRTSESQANRLLSKALERDAISPADVTARAADFRGKPAILPDLAGENVLGLARAAQATPSRAKEQLASTLRGRREGQMGRLEKDVQESVGLDPQNVYDTADNLIEERAKNAKPLYDAARAFGRIESPTINALLKRPAAQKALREARITAKNAGEPLPDGVVDVQTLDRVKQSLDDRISALYRGGKNGKAKVLVDLREQMLTELDDAVPAYKAARQQFAGDSQLRDALEAGRNFLKTDHRLTAKAIPLFSEGERDLYRIGALDDVTQAMSKAGSDQTDLVNKLFGNSYKRDQFRAMVGDDAYGKLIKKGKDAEGRLAHTEEFVLGGPATARIGSEIADMAGANIGEMAATGMDVARGNVPALLMRGAQALGRRASGNVGNVADNLSSKMLTAPGTPEFDALMKLLAESQKTRAANTVRGNVTRRALSATVGGNSQ